MAISSFSRLAGLLTLFLAASFPTLGHDNGLARTPIMGFSPYNVAGMWQFSDASWRACAKAVSMNGMKDAGYVYINNDCGMFDAYSRTADSTLILRRGLTNTADIIDYVHSLGLKAGIYMYPVEQNHQDFAGYITKDAQYAASLGCDFIKYDGWMATPLSAFEGMRDALMATGRPIVFSVNGTPPAEGIANMCRCSADIGPWWWSVIGSIGCVAAGTAKPGYWPDPDFMETGNLASTDEDMSAFSLWCVSSSPLISGTDPRMMDNWTHYILLNTEAIAVNQDTAFSVNPSYGGSGKLIRNNNGFQLWCKTVTGGAKAVVLVNTGESPATGSVTWTEIGIPSGTAQIRDLWEHKNLGSFTDQYSADLPVHGCFFLKILPGTEPIPEPVSTWYPKPPADIPFTELPKSGWTVASNLGSPEQYIDGSISTPAGGSGCASKNWIQVDMQTPQSFNVVTLAGSQSRATAAIRPYTGWGTDHTMLLSISSDGSTWTPVCSAFVGPKSYTLLACENQTARYIRIDHTRGSSGGSMYGFCVGEDLAPISELYVGLADSLPAAVFRPEIATARASGIKRQAPVRVLFLAGAAARRPGGRAALYTIQGRALGSVGMSSRTVQQSGVLIAREPR